MVLIKFLHKQMTEKIAFEVGLINCQQNLKYNFLDAIFYQFQKSQTNSEVIFLKFPHSF